MIFDLFVHVLVGLVVVDSYVQWIDSAILNAKSVQRSKLEGKLPHFLEEEEKCLHLDN